MQAFEHSSGAFQQPVSPGQVEAMCQRALGASALVTGAVEIGVGTYNSTYRVDVDGHDPVILRVAPERVRQLPGDHGAMRNEYAAAPYFVALESLVPKTLAADFTHQIVDRDYLVQTLLDGVPADTGLDAYPRSQWGSYYRQLADITRTIHDVRGERFGLVAGPGHASWSEALIAQFLASAGDFDESGLDSSGIHRIVASAYVHRTALDEVTEPRLLHGDLWRLNILLDPDATEPTIVGILDWDGASWGDPLSDWTIHRIRQQPGPEADAFWAAYGRPVEDANGDVRELFYRARNLIGARLDIHRRGINLDDVPPVHWDLSDVHAQLGQ